MPRAITTLGLALFVGCSAAQAPSYTPIGMDWFAEDVRLADCSVPMSASPSP